MYPPGSGKYCDLEDVYRNADFARCTRTHQTVTGAGPLSRYHSQPVHKGVLAGAASGVGPRDGGSALHSRPASVEKCKPRFQPNAVAIRARYDRACTAYTWPAPASRPMSHNRRRAAESDFARDSSSTVVRNGGRTCNRIDTSSAGDRDANGY